MENTAPRFYPGSTSHAAAPLARYLPPLPPGMLAGWLAENVPPGSWLLDPLGASPALVLEAARAGYRVLVASNNPIISFVIETLARVPKSAEFQSALAELAMAKRGDERLEKHLQNLYLTTCDTCGEQVPAQAFLWRKGEEQPYARIYRCPRCGESGPRDVTPADLERLAAMGGDKLQRARALQRVILNEDEQRADVEEALESYLTRPLYVLFTLINKMEGLGLPPERLRLLQALLISVFDAGNTLWPGPGGRSNQRQRPKQLTVPPQFRENNLWMALEAAPEEWVRAAAAYGGGNGTASTGASAAAASAAIPVTRWPELPSADGAGAAQDGTGAGGICLFRGRVKALMPLPEEMALGGVLTVLPRPNQAFWTLSVLWAGWLWGPEAALPLRNVLDRRRYDWNWHTSAIHSALAAVSWTIPPDTPCLAVLPELAPGFLSAAVVAAEAAGFRLDGLALREEQDLAMARWRPAPASAPASATAAGATATSENLETAAREAIRADLLARGEPAPYLTCYAAGLAGMARSGAIPRSLSSIPGDLLTRAQAVLARTFADRSLLRLYGGKGARPDAAGKLETTADEERGLWWLAGKAGGGFSISDSSPESAALPLADRVEMEVVRYLQKQQAAGERARWGEGGPGFTFAALDAAVCAQFPGLLTPPVELVRACLESYGEQVAGGPGGPQGGPGALWRMAAAESAASRKGDLLEMRAAIETTGQRMGFRTTEQGSALAWEREGKAEWWFFRMASSILSRYVLAPPPGPPERCVLVLPGSRARLLRFKLRRDPRLSEAAQGWRFLKFRHLREIAAGPRLGPNGWEPLLDEDPLTEEATQMPLFSE